MDLVIHPLAIVLAAVNVMVHTMPMALAKHPLALRSGGAGGGSKSKRSSSVLVQPLHQIATEGSK